MNMKLSSRILRIYTNQIRCLSNIKPKNHYMSLGVDRKATQNEIKSAYYKLSMIYHPDKNKDEASLKKFRDITEAYEVLGNVRTRKMYDGGFYYKPGASTPQPPPEKPENKFYHSRETRSRPPPPSGRTPIYDFDEWSKNHYGETFQRQMESKRRTQTYKNTKDLEMSSKRMEKVVFAVTAVILMIFAFNRDTDHDVVSYGSLGTHTVKKDNSNESDSAKTK